MTFRKHVLIATGLFVGVLVFIAARNWTTFALIVDNMTAMNEGEQAARQIQAPEDLLAYLAEHPEHVSVVAYDVGAPEDGIFYQAERPRPMVSVLNLMLGAEYARRAAAGLLDPDRRVPLAALDPYVLPGAGEEQHRHARAYWREQGLVDADPVNADSTVALRHIARAITQFGDRAAADWFIADLGRAEVDSLPMRFGLDDSAPPRPSSGTHLSWNHHTEARTVEARLAAYRALPQQAYADRVYRLTRRLRQDTTFRRQEHARLRRRGTDVSLRQQRALAQTTYPHGTAADYARWMTRLAQKSPPSDRASAFLQRQLEQTVQGDSVRSDSLQATLTIGAKSGALPGVISFVGYVRRGADRPPRVVAVLMEGIPIGLFYHLMQTGIDRGLYVQLLTDDAFFASARVRLHEAATATR